MGSWELAGTACQVHGLPIFQIAARQKNPYVDPYWHQLRSRGGTDDTVMRGSGAIRGVLRRLCDGQLLAILPDLRSRDEGFAVPFLGGTANIGRGMGLFARRTGVPIFIGIAPRHSWARLTFQVLDLIRPDPSLDKRADAERMTREVLATIDRVIRENPEQWFWFNKRWILDPLS
jgi:KDO2-lipid IV(A) lauroyltransferase